MSGPQRHTIGLVLCASLSVTAMAGSIEASRRPSVRQAHIEWSTRDDPLDVSGPGGAAHLEAHLALDPRDPEHWVVGSIVVSADRDLWHCAALVTFDGGVSWRRADFDEMERCIDPWVVIEPDGGVLLTAVEIVSGAETGERLRLVAFTSMDGGRSWSSEPNTLGSGFDHPIIVASSTEPEAILASRRNALAEDGRVRHRLSVGRISTDGKLFRETTSFTPAVVGLTASGLVTLPEDALVVTYWDFQRELDGFRSEGMLDRGRAWAVRSMDGGRTFGPPYLIGDHCASGGPERAFPGYPETVSDRSGGPYRDRLYHVCVRPGLDGVALSTSEDGGRRWSDPLRIDGGTGHARTPMVAVNDDGVVAAAWYDRRLDPEERCQDVYLTFSVDGGETFAQPSRVTSETSCPGRVANETIARSWPMGGDYGGLEAASDGSFVLVWADSRAGLFQLRQSRFRVRLP